MKNPTSAAIRLTLALAATVLLTACSGPGGGVESSASCAGPQLTVTPTTVEAGGSVKVHGLYYMDGCADTVANGKAATAAPLTKVPLTLRGGSGAAQEIARLDATGEIGEIDQAVDLPKTAGPGTVVLELGTAQPVSIELT